MPKRTDIRKILIIGSGPIVIGQACEFDYSGTQACKALREEGYEIVLVNSNPATIMTDPEMADRTYVEPITPEVVEKIIARERPQALLPTIGGQTGLNVSVALAERGTLDRYNVELIGAKLHAIKKAEDRELFKGAMEHIGLQVPKSGFARNIDEAMSVIAEVGFPVIIRSSFTLGGMGSGVAYNIEEFREMSARGMEISPISEILIEESVIGWKEFELEVMRDKNDNVVIICSIENIDPMGVHTGDSICVAPAQTLSDKEYQIMRDAAIDIIREIGVDTGGSNIQFAVNPDDGRLMVIEMNPRVSRSSALASKATGFPIAKIAAKLAVGYTLDEIPNDITKKTPASFEPTIDYVVVKIPRWAFEKFPAADQTLTTQMKSVGEAMSIGRTFKEAFQKGLRSLEISKFGFESPSNNIDQSTLHSKLSIPNPERMFYIKYSLQHGMTIDQIHGYSKIDKFFLHNLKEIVEMEEKILNNKDGNEKILREAKRFGFSDVQLSKMWNMGEQDVRQLRLKYGIEATFKTVDTCAAEFEAYTPYYYSTYESEDEVRHSDKRKIMILGGGPNRIGQGIEFDYCCVHASLALRDDGFETIMVNSNPETVSTDYDISDRLYFEPLTREDVLNIVDKEKPDGVIVQFGGQTPLNLAVPLEKAGVKILGTKPVDIDRAEDREKFKVLINKLGLRQPTNDTGFSFEDAKLIANRIGYPVVVRPSYVLGGRAMEIVYDDHSLAEYMKNAVEASPEHPILIDKYLEDAIEIDVDAISDGKRVVLGGIMEHIEEAGIHSGDSVCVLPPYTLSDEQMDEIKQATYDLARELNVIGLMNIQYAIKGDDLYILEVNPRASRTVPFVSKAIGMPLAKIAARVMAGKTLDEIGFTKEIQPEHFSVKGPVFPFARFRGVDPILGPEMRSTGEVMGIDKDLGMAYAKAQIGTGLNLPTQGTVFISVKNKDKRAIIFIAKQLYDMGFRILSTHGTAKILARQGIEVEPVHSIRTGRPNVFDYMKNNEVDLIINTPTGRESKSDEDIIRKTAIMQNIPCITTVSGAAAAVNGINALRDRKGLVVQSLQEYYV
jgi:carbamoyl-phosphate synthase large subunit